MLINILATGASMSQELADSLKGQNCIVVNDAYKLAPWAMALCAQDHEWWRVNPDAKLFQGRRFSANKVPGTEQVFSDYVQRQSSSGVLGLEVARRLLMDSRDNEKIIALHGYNNSGTHYFGRHKEPLKNTSPSRFAIFEQQLTALGSEMKKAGIRIINKTPNSALECFERG